MWRVLIVVVGIAFALVVGACGSDGESAAEELARQHEVASARRDAAREARQAERVKQLQREVGELRQRSEGTAPATSSAGVSSPEPDADGDWPGGTGYTAILGSLSTEAEARRRQAEATSAGLDAGVLFSSDFSSLRPGYWVVFSGVYASAEEAEARVGRARELGYADAYPRFVAP